MLRGILKKGGILSLVPVSILLLIFGESILIMSIVWFGPLVTLIFFTIAYWLASYFLLQLYYKRIDTKIPVIIKCKSWIRERESMISYNKNKILRYGKVMGIVIFDVTTGPLATTILMGFLGYGKRNGMFYTFLLSLFFFILWITVYLSGIKIINKVT